MRAGTDQDDAQCVYYLEQASEQVSVLIFSRQSVVPISVAAHNNASSSHLRPCFVVEYTALSSIRSVFSQLPVFQGLWESAKLFVASSIATGWLERFPLMPSRHVFLGRQPP